MEIANTPAAITGEIRSFFDSLVPDGGEPIYIDKTPAPKGEVGECFATIERQVKQFKGSMVLGWLMWEMPGLLLTAELHAVWREPKGRKLHDLTPPNRPDITRVLFTEDAQRTYDGQVVQSVRRALSDHPAVAEHIALQDACFQFKMLRGGGRAGKILVTARDKPEWDVLQGRLSASQSAMRELYGRPLPPRG